MNIAKIIAYQILGAMPKIPGSEHQTEKSNFAKMFENAKIQKDGSITIIAPAKTYSGKKMKSRKFQIVVQEV